MTAQVDDRDWYLRMPVGYRVGAWEVTAPIAAGSSGSVYAARQADGQDAGRTAALKFISVTSVGQRQLRAVLQSARREADFSIHAEHEHIVTVFGTFVVDEPDGPADGSVVLAMELGEQSVQDLLAASAGTRPAGAEQLIVQICDGLTYLHEAGWVHGDLKPSNILLRPDGTACLADFGLVTKVEGTHGYGLPLGSIDYTPPERAAERLGERGVLTRQSADVWALGVTVHQILTGGAYPIEGATPSQRAATAQEIASGRTGLRLHPDLDAGWRSFVTDCLDADHARRPTAQRLTERARELAGRPPDTPPSPRHRKWWLTAAAFVVLVAAGLLWVRAADNGTHRAAAKNPAVPIVVYNADAPCRARTDRPYTCSIGLSLDPTRAYDASNVAAHRVWHGDRLLTDCQFPGGRMVRAEDGTSSAVWLRVTSDSGAHGYSWLPSIRTKTDIRDLPTCP